MREISIGQGKEWNMKLVNEGKVGGIGKLGKS